MNPTDKPNLPDLRVSYDQGELDEHSAPADPLALFTIWINDALAHKLPEPNAMSLATNGLDGTPTVRTVLLKGIDERGFHFYTNYESRKGQEIEANPRAAMVFYWSHQERQVCIAGNVTKLSREESAAYFQTRPRASRLAAWASLQSRPVESRAILERRWKEFDGAFAEGKVPMPDHWGGYVLSPVRMEFWQGRPGRFHDRFGYAKQLDAGWRLERLCP